MRWPGPILIATLAIALIGLLALPGYKTSYDVSTYMPASAPSNVGYAAAERHFSKARLNPELLMIETDHDLRNPTDMILLERVAKAVFHTDGIAQVQSITRPLGTPLDHTSIPFQISTQQRGADQQPAVPAGPRRRPAQAGRRDRRHDQHPARSSTRCSSSPATSPTSRARRSSRPSPRRRTCATRSPTSTTSSGRCATTSIGSRTVSTSRSAAAFRSLFDALDGIDALTDQLANVSASIAKLDELQPKLLALIPPQIANQQTNRDLTMTNYATTSGIYDQTAAALENSTALGQAYDASKTDDSFYLPPEAFTNPEFLRGLKLFLSPDGKAARMIITHDVDPATPEGISHIEAMRHAAQEAVKGTPLAGRRSTSAVRRPPTRTSRRWRTTT